MTGSVTYVSLKLGTKIRRKGGRGFFQFKSGTLVLSDPAEIAELEELMKEFTGSSIGLIRKLDEGKATLLAKKHKAEMLRLKNVTVQGVVTAAHKAGQIHEATTHLKNTEAAHLGISLNNPMNPDAPNQLGVVAAGDKQNPTAEDVKNAAENAAKSTETKTETVKFNMKKAT